MKEEEHDNNSFSLVSIVKEEDRNLMENQNQKAKSNVTKTVKNSDILKIKIAFEILIFSFNFVPKIKTYFKRI